MHLHLAQLTRQVTGHITHSRPIVSAMPGIRPVNLTQLTRQQVTRSNVILQPVRESLWRESVLRTERSHTTNIHQSPAAAPERHRDATMPSAPVRSRALPMTAPTQRAAPAAATSWTELPRPTRATTRPEIAEPPAQWRARSAPALVWRNPEPQSATQVIESVLERPAPSPTPVNAATRPLQANCIAALPMQVQHFARETQRALLLDASLTERLAEDVLKKVDKRLRIERERRGL